MVGSKRVKLQDVADAAGVSMMTVSRVLSKEGIVSEKTREKVLKVVAALNYRPNVSARRLASSKSFFIGLLYDNPSHSYISQFLISALKTCRAQGYHLVVDETDSDIEKTIQSVEELISVTQVDGLVLLPPVCDSEEVLSTLIKANIPFVRIAPDKQLNLSPYICMDDYQAAFDLTESLIKQGHTKIGHIIGDLNQGVSQLRYQAYLDALSANNIKSNPDYIEYGSFTYQSGMVAAQKLLTLENRPTAIFAANDDMAAAVISIAQKQGIQVPSELSVVGFDDTQLASIVWPNISTVKQPIDEMAALAISLLSSGKFNDPSNQQIHALRHVLDFTIIERESSNASKV